MDPQEREYVEYLRKLLHAASTVQDTDQQRLITKSMDDFNTLPEADRYLLILLTDPSTDHTSANSANSAVRGMAGLILKNNLKKRIDLPMETVNFFKNHHPLLQALADPMHLVRSTVGTLLATIAGRLGENLFTIWPELIPTLLTISRDAQVPMCDSASEALLKICEDVGEELAAVENSNLDLLIEGLIGNLGSVSEKVRMNSLLSLNCFILHVTPLQHHLPTLLHHLSQVANNSQNSSGMRRAICQTMHLLVDLFPIEMAPMISSVMEYMFMALSQNTDDAVGLDACEFWYAVVERDSFSDAVKLVSDRLVPLLLLKMVYSEDDPDLEYNGDGDGDDASAKPRHHHHQDQDKESSDEDDVEVSSWTIRKCAAATLDTLANTLDVIPMMLPRVSEMLNHSNDWRYQEAAILAIGAVSIGCSEGIEEHLYSLIPFLIQTCNASPVPLVKAITCWTLGRYATWISKDHHLSGSVMQMAILPLMVDGNAKVQHAASTALGVFAETTPSILLKSIDHVLSVVSQCLIRYHDKNLMVLLDALRNIIDNCIDQQSAGKMQQVAGILMEKWNSTKEDDQTLFPLLECMCSLAITSPLSISPYTGPIYHRALKMIEATMKARGDIEYDFCIVALDLLGGMVQGLGETLTTLFVNSSFDILLARCLREGGAPDVRQSAFALIGDMAIACRSPLRPLLVDTILFALADNIEVSNSSDDLDDEDDKSLMNTQSSANNAVWALGELALSFPNEMAPHLSLVTPRLCHLLIPGGIVGRGYSENVAITLARCLGVVTPPYALLGAVKAWSKWMSGVKDPRERETAWLPMLNTLLANPMYLRLEDIPTLCNAVASFNNPPAPIKVLMGKLLQLIKEQIVGPQMWVEFRKLQLLHLKSEFFHQFNL